MQTRLDLFFIETRRGGIQRRQQLVVCAERLLRNYCMYRCRTLACRLDCGGLIGLLVHDPLP